jgi:hypothetical protein
MTSPSSGAPAVIVAASTPALVVDRVTGVKAGNEKV